MLFPIIGLIFLAAFCGMVAIYLAVTEVTSSPKAELKKRLQRMAASGTAQGFSDELKSEITKEMAPADRLMATVPFLAKLDQRLDHAGIRSTVSAFVIMTSGIAVCCGMLVALLSRSVLLGLCGVAVSALLTEGYIRGKTERRLDRFTEFFPDALTMIARSLRAGHSFTSAVQLIGQEIPPPVGELFRMAYDQQQLGLRLADALSNLNERIDSLDLRFFTTAVNINTEIGGNLSEILDKLAMTIRERLRIRRQVRVYTAQGRMSGYVLGALPVFAFVMFNILNPKYEAALIKEPLGVMVLLSAALMQVMGLLIIRKIIRIRI